MLAYPNSLDMQDGLQPIHFAAKFGHIEIIQALLDDYGVNPNSNSKVSSIVL